jgi:hypothetical protein
MVIRTKNEELLLLFVPVASQASEYCSSIKKGMRCNANLGLGKWNYLPLKKNVTLSGHSDTSRCG